MMKKTLLALSVAGAFIGTASAAPQIELYGLINTGFSYVHSDSDLAGEDAKDSFSMETGKEFGSRWGIRGSEDLGNGLKVSFTLESGFASDTGASEQSRLFGRESHVDLSGSFGTVSFGLMPIFGSVLGANGLFRAIDPLFANYTVGFGSGHATASMWTRVDNAVSYRTPTFAGLTGYAMYSFKNDSVGASKTGEESKAESDRYASLALRYLNSNFEAILVADTTLYGSVDSRLSKTAKSSIRAVSNIFSLCLLADCSVRAVRRSTVFSFTTAPFLSALCSRLSDRLRLDPVGCSRPALACRPCLRSLLSSLQSA